MKIKAVAPIRYGLEDQSCLPSLFYLVLKHHLFKGVHFAGKSYEIEVCKGMRDAFRLHPHIADLVTLVQSEFVIKSARKLVTVE